LDSDDFYAGLRMAGEQLRAESMGDSMDELDVARLDEALAGGDYARVVLRDLVRAAARKDRYSSNGKITTIRCTRRFTTRTRPARQAHTCGPMK
jgi:hypothetical protein